MANRCNMPVKQEQAATTSEFTGTRKLYKPLPYKAGESAINKILVTLCQPNRWKFFNPAPDMIRKYGLASDPIFAEELRTFYFRLKVHDVPNFVRPDSSVGFSQVLCPLQFNKYLTEALGCRPLFENPRCAFCEEEQHHWEITNARWDELGIDKNKMNKDGYWDTIKKDPVLSVERKAIDMLQAKEKVVVPVFDHSKFIGARPMGEEETQIEHQLWFAPKMVFDKLVFLYSPPEGEKEILFFEPTSEGYPVLSIIKDTTKCHGNDLKQTKYDVSFRGEYHQYPQEWLNYLMNYDAQVDPSDFVFMVTYEEGKVYAADLQSSRNDYRNPSANVAAQAAPNAALTVPPGFNPPAVGFVPQAPLAQSCYAPPTPAAVPPVGITPPLAMSPPVAAPVPIQPQMTAPVPAQPPMASPPVAHPAPTPPSAPTSPAMVAGPARTVAVPNRVPPAGETPPGSRRSW